MNEKLDRFHRYMVLYEKMVKRYAETFVGSHLAEDVAQEVLFAMYRKMDCLSDQTVKKWLLIVTRNIALDYLKKGGSIDVYPMDPELLPEYMENTTEDFFEKREKQKAAAELCRTAFDLLYRKNPKWYEVIIDSDVLGMNSSQIAKELGVTQGHVNILKFRARKYLRQKLGREYEECR